MAMKDAGIDGPDRDPDLERVYSQTSREEPRSELDQTIRAAARREVQARPHAVGARLRQWTLPVSLAAVIVLSVSIVTLMREEGAGRLEEDLSSVPARPDADAGAPSRAAKAAGSAEAPAVTRTPVPLAAPPSAKDTTADDRLGVPAAGRVRPAEPFTGEVRQKAAQSAKESKLEESPATPEASATAPAPRPARVLSAPASSLRRAPTETEGGASGKRELAKSKRLLTENQLSELLKELEQAPPEKWLEEIAALHREGDSQAADELLARFRGRFPDYPVPERERSN